MTTDVEDMVERDCLAAALVILARNGIPTDVQELLVRGDPMRDIPPGTLLAALRTIAGERDRAEECRRWNIDRYGEELRVCRGDHEKGEKCEWEVFVPASQLTAAEEAERLLEPFARAAATLDGEAWSDADQHWIVAGLTVGHLRAARDFLATQKEKTNGAD